MDPMSKEEKTSCRRTPRKLIGGLEKIPFPKGKVNKKTTGKKQKQKANTNQFLYFFLIKITERY